MQKLHNYLMSSISYDALVRGKPSLYDALSEDQIKTFKIILGI